MGLYQLMTATLLLAGSATAQTPAAATAAASPPEMTAPATPAAPPAANVPAVKAEAASPAPAAGAMMSSMAPEKMPMAGQMGKKGSGMQAKFDAANTTHDGKLTKEQAQAAHMKGIVKNFDKVDADHKGYVTLEDINAYHKAMHSKKSMMAPAPATDAAPAGK